MRDTTTRVVTYKATVNLFVEAPVEFMANERIAELLEGWIWEYLPSRPRPHAANADELKQHEKLQRKMAP